MAAAPSGIGNAQAAGQVGPKKRSRAKAPKVRTGCLTCKIRRVKCDEGKPACKRCVRFGIACDGYLQTKQEISTIEWKRNVQRIIEPKQSALAVLCRSPSTSQFTDDGEFYYFQLFSSQTAPQLSSCTQWTESQLWSQIVLQASETEPCIRHAVIAIGALDFKDWSSWVRRQDMTNPRRQVAYREYHRAILSLKQGIVENRIDLRTRVLVTLLFACFECFDGNNDEAVSQIVAGTEMVGEYLRVKATEERSHATYACPRLEESIYMTFAVAEVQAMAYGARKSNEWHVERMNNSRAAMKPLPTQFSTLQEAAQSLALIILGSCHWWLTRKNSLFSPSGGNFVTLVEGPPLPSESPISQLSVFMTEYEQWNVAFKAVWRRAKTPQGKGLFKRTALVRLFWLSGYLWFASGVSNSQVSRRFTRELEEVIHLSTTLMELPGESVIDTSFCFDTRVVLPLTTVGFAYRHRACRRRVIEIFSKMSRREGLWDTILTRKVIAWVAQLEEVGLTDEDYVPDDAVLRVTSMDSDTSTRSTLVRGVQRVRGTKSRTILRETVIYWDRTT
ncbi:hypothetical protein L207DRAFT_478524 [Hyaloscypha variabilis F]|uniref:Zn(2)-C6 fungal-type domain-containing protein n=1 Tax=Hyaloscypha variabilis (strain UAMH 11265 / GT02V1 / F) TaxID=1149755 RepID=A0A2J6S9K3_HYAVF|nr:hypothetical protein L207DRAFT_478524 [Hyaloscypha variabilis F]